MVLGRVPLAPTWNNSSGCVCTPDGGLLYVGSRSINYIRSIKNSNSGDISTPEIKIFQTRQFISSIDVDPGWAEAVSSNKKNNNNSDDEGNVLHGERLFAAVAADNSVQIWDFDRGCAISGHKAHFSAAQCMDGISPQSNNDRVICSFMKNRNILSLNSQELVVYCIASNTYFRRATFLSRKLNLNVLRCSPHNESIFAVGTTRGLIIIGDLEKMNIVYTLRGHDTTITSLAWCPPNDLQIQRVAQQPSNQQNDSEIESLPEDSDEIFDIYDFNHLDHEFGVSSDDKARKETCEDFVGLEKDVKFVPSSNFDFVEACQSLKEEINALQKDNDDVIPDVTLADCQQVPYKHNLSSSCNTSINDSVVESLEIGARSSSDDELCVDGIEPTPKKQILHQAEVHAEQSSEPEKKRNLSEIETKDNNDKVPQDRMNSSNQPKELSPLTRSQSYHQKNMKNQKNVDMLLASASKDGCIWLWNASTGASCDRHHDVAKHGKNENIEIVWLNSTQFLTNNKAGELQHWSLNLQDSALGRYKCKIDKEKKFPQGKVVSFNVAKKQGLLWTISYLREIKCERMKTKEVLQSYCCASTSLQVMRECPDDMNKIALGFADRRIGIFDVSKFSAANVHIDNFTSFIDSAVQSLTWSPDGNALAFGTVEGRIGILHIENKRKVEVFNPICGKPIYSIEWYKDQIFVVCNQMLAVYDATFKNKDGKVISEVECASFISVRFDKLFVGTQRGHLAVYNCSPDDYKLIEDLTLAPRYITEIAWSPIDKNKVAVVSNTNIINIFAYDTYGGKLTPIRKIEIQNKKAANSWVKWSNQSASEFLTCGFDGCVRVWDLNCDTNVEKFLKQFHCPMYSGLFLPTDEKILICAGKSTSVELIDMRVEKTMAYSAAKWKRSNTANPLEYVKWALKIPLLSDKKSLPVEMRQLLQQADPKTAKRSSTYTENTENVTAKMNSLKLDENVQHSGKEKSAEEKENVQHSGKDKSAKAKEYVNHSGKEKSAEEKENVQHSRNEKSPEGQKNLHRSAKEESVEENVSKQTELPVTAYKKTPRTLLLMTTRELNQDIVDRVVAATNETNNKQMLCAKLFGTKSQAKELAAKELNNNKHVGPISNIMMNQINSSLKDEIIRCIKNKQLNEWHVSLAPSISYKFWEKCCEAFAEQLQEQGYVFQAATYIIGLHRHLEAVEMLVSKSLYKEALLMARIYLQPDDPLISNIIEKWISQLETTGNLSAAALLCVFTGQYNRAVEILSKMRNIPPNVEHLISVLKTKQDYL